MWRTPAATASRRNATFLEVLVRRLVPSPMRGTSTSARRIVVIGGTLAPWGRDPVRGISRDPPGTPFLMQIGTSIFLIAIGAIMRYAVNVNTDGFSINTAGLILMVAGVIELI